MIAAIAGVLLGPFGFLAVAGAALTIGGAVMGAVELSVRRRTRTATTRGEQA